VWRLCKPFRRTGGHGVDSAARVHREPAVEGGGRLVAAEEVAGAARVGHLIAATALTRSSGNARVLSDVSLNCQPGTITGFLGPKGAGSPRL
jgi:hypothetical protein